MQRSRRRKTLKQASECAGQAKTERSETAGGGVGVGWGGGGGGGGASMQKIGADYSGYELVMGEQ